MKACPFCAEEIRDAAVVCKHCQRALSPVPKTDAERTETRRQNLRVLRLLGGVSAVLTIIAVVTLVLGSGGHASSTAPPTSPPAQSSEDVTWLRDHGVLKRLDTDAHEAYVDAGLWNGVDVDAKRGMVMALSKHFERVRGTGQVKVLDHQSGRLLASYSVWSGVEFK